MRSTNRRILAILISLPFFGPSPHDARGQTPGGQPPRSGQTQPLWTWDDPLGQKAPPSPSVKPPVSDYYWVKRPDGLIEPVKVQRMVGQPPVLLCSAAGYADFCYSFGAKLWSELNATFLNDIPNKHFDTEEAKAAYMKKVLTYLQKVFTEFSAGFDKLCQTPAPGWPMQPNCQPGATKNAEEAMKTRLRGVLDDALKRAAFPPK
jgi:hypothetical protein